MSKWKVIYWDGMGLRITFVECSAYNLSMIVPSNILNGLIRIDRVPSE